MKVQCHEGGKSLVKQQLWLCDCDQGVTSLVAGGLLSSYRRMMLIFQPWDSYHMLFFLALPATRTEVCLVQRWNWSAMEQYTANSNSSTEQIVVQAGQIQQQVREVKVGDLALPVLNCKPASSQSSAESAESARSFMILSGCVFTWLGSVEQFNIELFYHWSQSK